MFKEVKCIDTQTPRIDGRDKKLSGITLGKTYQVLGVPKQYFYRIINDEGRAANYMQIRFEDVKENACSCGADGVELHTCPLKEDVKGDTDTKCNCCSDCEYVCYTEI